MLGVKTQVKCSL